MKKLKVLNFDCTMLHLISVDENADVQELMSCEIDITDIDKRKDDNDKYFCSIVQKRDVFDEQEYITKSICAIKQYERAKLISAENARIAISYEFSKFKQFLDIYQELVTDVYDEANQCILECSVEQALFYLKSAIDYFTRDCDYTIDEKELDKLNFDKYIR